MKISENGMNFIKKHEGFKTAWYDLKDGGLTVGFGNYITYAEANRRGIKVGQKITAAEANEMLNTKLASFVAGTNTQLKQYGFTVNQNQFDALVSYAYNRGLGNAAGTNGLRELLSHSKSVTDISKNFLIYWGTNTMYKKGLLNRRSAEKELFDKAVGTVKVAAEKKAIVKKESYTRYKVTADLLNIRKKPSNSGKILGQLKKGNTVQVVSIDKNGWAKVKSNTDFVYLYSLYLTN